MLCSCGLDTFFPFKLIWDVSSYFMFSQCFQFSYIYLLFFHVPFSFLHLLFFFCFIFFFFASSAVSWFCSYTYTWFLSKLILLCSIIILTLIKTHFLNVYTFSVSLFSSVLNCHRKECFQILMMMLKLTYFVLKVYCRPICLPLFPHFEKKLQISSAWLSIGSVFSHKDYFC